MKYLFLLGRVLYAGIFLLAVAGHFSQRARILAGLGGLNIALGFKAKGGAWLIILFLIPVTLWMHAFWKETDPMQIQIQANFMKNMSLLGAAFLISYIGSGPLSLDHLMKPKIKVKGFIVEES